MTEPIDREKEIVDNGNLRATKEVTGHDHMVSLYHCESGMS